MVLEKYVSAENSSVTRLSPVFVWIRILCELRTASAKTAAEKVMTNWRI
jgi:hypothetical protein